MAARRASASTLHERIAMQGPSDEIASSQTPSTACWPGSRRPSKRSATSYQRLTRAAHAACHHAHRSRRHAGRSQANGEELRRMAETVRTAVARSEDIIDGLLVLAESEQIAAREGRARRRSRRRWSHGASPPPTPEGCRCPRPAPAAVRGDAALLERLVDNLVDNSVRYASAGSVVTIAVGGDPGGVMLRVSNAGEAIDPRRAPISSSASTGAARRAAGTTAARDWAWRSSRRWLRLMAGGHGQGAGERRPDRHRHPPRRACRPRAGRVPGN